MISTPYTTKHPSNYFALSIVLYIRSPKDDFSEIDFELMLKIVDSVDFSWFKRDILSGDISFSY